MLHNYMLTKVISYVHWQTIDNYDDDSGDFYFFLLTTQYCHISLRSIDDIQCSSDCD